MLRMFRKNIKLIIWLIVLSFMGWGVGSFTVSRDQATSYAGSIRGEKIANTEYLMTFRFYELLTSARRRQTEPEPPLDAEPEAAEVSEQAIEDASTATEDAPEAEQPEEPGEADSVPVSLDQIRSLTWQTLVLSREAKRERIEVSDNEVRDRVRSLFSPDGSFNHFLYESWIKRNFRGQPRDFEEVTRRHLMTEKLRTHYLKDVAEEDQDSHWLGKLISIMSQAKFEDYTVQNVQDSPAS